GNVNWHTGQEILKKAATTGPRSIRVASEYSLLFKDLSENPGAVFPATMCVIGSCFPIQRESRRKIPIASVYRTGAQSRKGGQTVAKDPVESGRGLVAGDPNVLVRPPQGIGCRRFGLSLRV